MQWVIVIALVLGVWIYTRALRRVMSFRLDCFYFAVGAIESRVGRVGSSTRDLPLTRWCRSLSA